MIKKIDSLEFMKQQKDYSLDIVYSDPPYALGSEIIIRKDGKVDYAKAVDFMNKWDMPTGDWWEQWFKETYRSLKHGGYCIMFGMDRQLLLFKYYASLSGFQEQQSIYWFFISGFPKASDLGRMIDGTLGVKSKVIGTKTKTESWIYKGNNVYNTKGEKKIAKIDIIKPSSELSKKYDGYKYSVAPLKQTNETVMVFQKPYKTGSCLHDILAMEKGDDTITCGALNIDGGRIPTSDVINSKLSENKFNENAICFCASNIRGSVDDKWKLGRFPSQTFVDNETAEKIDRQSGNIVAKSSNIPDSIGKGTTGMFSWGGNTSLDNTYTDNGGASKILHKCNYEAGEFDLYKYQPKVSKSERDAGLVYFDTKEGGVYKFRLDGSMGNPIPKRKNLHPTLKPIILNERILKLFKTPNPQKICYAFADAGSEIIGGIRAGFDNWIACELSQEYIDIANARIEYWSSKYTIINDKKIWDTDGLTNAPEDAIEQTSLFDL